MIRRLDAMFNLTPLGCWGVHFQLSPTPTTARSSSSIQVVLRHLEAQSIFAISFEIASSAGGFPTKTCVQTGSLGDGAVAPDLAIGLYLTGSSIPAEGTMTATRIIVGKISVINNSSQT